MNKHIYAGTALLCMSSIVIAQDLPQRGPHGLPKAEYAEARETLAKACIAEEGWGDFKGCAAVAHVYARKYKARSRPNTTLRSIVERHCAALRPGRAHSKRSYGLSNLPTTLGQFPGKSDTWTRTLAFLDKWYMGRAKDPCRGAAVDFGGADDNAAVGAVRVECDGPDNRYYEIHRKK